MVTEKVKAFLGGVLSATGVWMIVVNLREYLLEVSPISNQYILGATLILIGGLLTKRIK